MLIHAERLNSRCLTALFLLCLTALALLVHGYHLGIEDEAIYLPAVRQHLDPALYPHDTIMFEPQTRPTLMDEIVAASVRATGCSLPTMEFAWHLLSLFLFLSGCWLVARRVFFQPEGSAGAVTAVAVLLTLPVAGVAIYLADQHLHPRTLATALVLIGASVLLPGERDKRLSLDRSATALLLVAMATVVHVQMAFYGLIFLTFLVLPLERFGERAIRFTVLLTPLATLFQSAPPEWYEAARIKRQHYLLRWEWYEWLGIIGPIVILYLLARWAKNRRPEVHSLALRTALLGCFALVVTLVLTTPARLERLTSYQPLRMFHSVYLVMVLLFGGLAAELWMKRRWWRWAVLVLPFCAGMWYAQRDLFPKTHHIEWPNQPTGNAWVESFNWVRTHTPKDAYFALDRHFQIAYGEDYHGFRALSERGNMADWDKDSGVACLFPSMAPRWSREVHALARFNQFGTEDFAQLKRQFGVTWVVLEYPYIHQYGDGRVQVRGYVGKAEFAECPYQNEKVRVCRLK